MSCFHCCTTSLFKLSEGRSQKYRMWQQTLKCVLNWVSRWVSSSLTSHVYIQNGQWYGADSIQASYVHISTDAWNYRLWTRSAFSSISDIKYVILTCHTWMFSQVLNTLLAARFTPVSFPENISMSLNVTNCCQAAIVSTGSHGAFISTWRTARDGVTCRWVFDNRSLSHHSRMTSQLWFI